LEALSGHHPRHLALQPRLPTYDDIVDHCCFAWNRLVDQPWTIMRHAAGIYRAIV
jgi:hypothetical protein